MYRSPLITSLDLRKGMRKVPHRLPSASHLPPDTPVFPCLNCHGCARAELNTHDLRLDVASVQWVHGRTITWWQFFPTTNIYDNIHNDFFSLQMTTFLACLCKSSSKRYSLSIHCQKSKEPNQQKVTLGDVFILEASKSRTEHRDERSSSVAQ